MKLYKRLLLFGTSLLLLTACGENSNVDDAEETTEKPETEEVIEDVKAKETDKVTKEEETMEIDSTVPLENVGEYKYTVEGRVELIDIIRPTDTYTFIDNVFINFHDVKILQYTEMPENLLQTFKDDYGYERPNYSVQLSYSVTNNTDGTVGGLEPIDLVTSNGKQYNIYDNGGYIQGSSYEVRPNATTDSGVVFYIENPDLDGINLYFQPLDSEGLHLDEISIHLDF